MLHQFTYPVNNIFGQSPQIMWQAQQYEHAQHHHNHNHYYQQQIQQQMQQQHQQFQLPLLLPQVSCSKPNLRKDSEIDSVLSGYSTESEFFPEKQSACIPMKGKRKQLQLAAKQVHCFEGNYQNSMSQGAQKITEQPIKMNPQKQQGFSQQQQVTQRPQTIYVQKQSIIERSQQQIFEIQQISSIQSQPSHQQQNKTSNSTAIPTSSSPAAFQLPSSTSHQQQSSSPTSIFSSSTGIPTSSSPSIPLNNATSGAFEKFKTEMCKNWVEKGKCGYGQKCQFAHGKHELVDKRQAGGKLYKSKLCNTFHSTGMCPYGSRCMFIHEDRTMQEIKECFFFQNKLKSDDTILETRTIGSRLQFFEKLTKNELKTVGESGVAQEENALSTL